MEVPHDEPGDPRDLKTPIGTTVADFYVYLLNLCVIFCFGLHGPDWSILFDSAVGPPNILDFRLP